MKQSSSAAPSTRASHGRPRLQDVADAAGVSIATASKVINGRANVADDTRDRVERAVRELGYVRTRIAEEDRSGLIEVVFTAFSHFWVPEVLQGASAAAEDHGLRIEVCAADADTSWADRAIGSQAMGVIAVMPSPAPEVVAQLTSRRIPCVCLDPWGNPAASGMLAVQTDFWMGGLLAARHLIGLGHTRIATITGQVSEMRANAQLDGFGSALDEAGIARRDDYVVRSQASCARGREAALDLLQRTGDDRPTAIVAQTDLIAMGVYQAAGELGLRIPRDLSVVGYDDIRPSQYMAPALTTVNRPMQRMAQTAVEMIVAQHDGAGSTADAVAALAAGLGERRAILPPALIERHSTAAPFVAA